MTCPSRHVAYDYMHVYFVTGIFNVHCGLLVGRFQDFGIAPSRLHDFFRRVHLPKRLPMNKVDVFSERCVASTLENWTLKATASECLTIVPILALFVFGLQASTRVPALQEHCACFLLLARVVGLLLRSARGLTGARELQLAILAHLAEFKRLFGDEFMRPKFHYAMHLWLYLLWWGFLPLTYIQERKHKTVKAFGDCIDNVSCDWDASVLRECTASRLHALADAARVDFSDAAALIGLRRPERQLLKSLQATFGDHGAGVFAVAKSAKVSKYERVHLGDVVMVAAAGGALEIGKAQVLLRYHAAAAADQDALAIVELWYIDEELPRSWKCIQTVHSRLLEAHDINCALFWSGTAPVFQVLKPMHAVAYPDM